MTDKYCNMSYKNMADIIWKIRCEVKSRGGDQDVVASIGDAYDNLDWLASEDEES